MANPTVAELEAQLKTARNAEAKAEEDRKRQLAEARAREEVTLTDTYIVALQVELKARGIESKLKPGKVGQYGGAVYASLEYPKGSEAAQSDILPRLERRNKGYSSEYSYQIQFGRYGRRKTYPRLKDGTFNYAKIADEMMTLVQSDAATRKHYAEATVICNASQALVNALQDEFGLQESSLLSASNSAPEQVAITIKGQCGVVEARALLVAARNAGLIASYQLKEAKKQAA